jgi:hypothetical protein
MVGCESKLWQEWLGRREFRLDVDLPDSPIWALITFAIEERLSNDVHSVKSREADERRIDVNEFIFVISEYSWEGATLMFVS